MEGAMVLWWNQRRKQGSKFGVGGLGLLLGVQNQGSTTVLSQKGDGYMVFRAVLFFVDLAVFFICKGKSWDTRSFCMVWEPLWSKQATMLHCGFHYKVCRMTLPTTQVILWHLTLPQLLCLVFRFCGFFLVLAVVIQSPILP